ncbi:CLUMA_CG018209, isoform A, partial [Clunio marinus]
MLKMSSKLPSERNKNHSIEEVLSRLSDEKLNGDFDEIFNLMPVTTDTSCGIGFLRSPTLQRFANKKFLVGLYGVLSLVFASAGSYFNGTITTIEKRFEIPSKNIGIISVGNDVSSLFLSVFIAYYGGKSHRPRWIGVGLLAIVVFCLINALPHFIFGSGSEALSLTIENGGVKDGAESEAAEKIENNKLLCKSNATDGIAAECNLTDGGSLTPQILLFIAQLIAGVGQTLCSTLGFSYLDDNIKKSKTPALMSISFFMRLLGPALGYALASLCLKIYIAPELTPVINNKDPRWLGAWWLGWLIFAFILCLFSFTVAMLPKELPRAAVRKRIEKEKVKRGLKMIDTSAAEDTKASIPDMIVTYKRLFRNKVFMLMNIAGIFHLFGFLPYWIYTPKIIETVYHQSASASSFYTGTLAIVFSGIGVLIGGVYISKYKPSARFLTMWHIICGVICVIGIISYAFLGCVESGKTLSVKDDAISICNKDCHCDFVRYSPVCGTDGLTYISACHAGCKKFIATNDTKTFKECSCVGSDVYKSDQTFSWELNAPPKHSATSGPCPVNCQRELFMFLAVMCLMKFIGATGRTSNFLVSIRCIDEKDKTVAIGLGSTLIHLFALIPSPIFFGYILDSVCLVSGKTCTGKGNCWLYNEESLRYVLNFSAAFFIAIGTIIDVESIEEALSKLTDEQLNGDFDDILELMPVTNDTSCAFGFMRRSMLKKLTSKKFLVALYSILSLAFASTGSYFNGTITTLEKRFEIPTKNIGIIWVGNDVSSLFLYIVITYYGGKSHRPRWIGVGLLAIVVFCLINALPHFIFGSGSEALSLTIENGGVKDGAESEAAEKIENNKLLCKSNATDGIAAECNLADGGSLTPQILLFIAQLIAGVGQTLCSTLGFSYLDDNVKKTKKPALLSISFFMRFLGPAFGYLLASLCLKIYIAPELTPVINNKDPRWLGAWWLGWLIFAFILCLFSFTVAMLPKELPRAAVRKRIEKEKVKRGLKMIDTSAAEDTKASIPDMIVTYKRLFRNKVFMLMNIAGIFHLFGFLPYWIYTPKIIETVYHQSASASSFYTGTLAIVFSGIGVLIGGVYISKYKPSARFLTMWHIICGVICVIGIISYAFLGCVESGKTLSVKDDAISICNKDCHCDFVRYSPVCGTDGLTYISACHAGCKKFIATNDTKTFKECSCVGSDVYKSDQTFSWELTAPPKHSATSGPCPVNCQRELFMFLAVMCLMKFIGATGRTSNFLVSIRCIDEKDKTVAIGLGSTLIHLFALIPSPIFFGYILDSVCLVSGKTCTGKGNCWLYNEESLRYVLNFSAAFFIAIGTIIDVATDGVAAECNLADGGSLTPQILLFIAQLIAGVGQTLCSTLGFSYLDDNIKKSKTPALMSISFFMRLLGPALGYALASLCLKIYIAPELTPVINNKDPRWLGAWWLGWLIFAFILCLFSFTVAMLPKELPRAAVRKRIEKEKVKRGLKMIDTNAVTDDTKASIPDMIVTYKRLFRNKVFMLMNIAGIFHLFGLLPYWIYTPKIIETVYHQSASTSSFITGTLAIVFSGIGVLIGGVYISKYKPSARFLSLWHIICGILCIVGMFAFSSVGCDEGRKTLSVKNDAISICNKDCHCDFVRYSPVCGTDGLTYISACHAGCKKFIATNDTKTFKECSCVGIDNYDNNSSFSWELTAPPKHSATSGPCPVNCKKELLKFRIIMCFMKFIAATGRTTNVLLSIKCIGKKERVAAIVFGAMLIHIFALIPSPIFFGFIFDSVCLVSGKTCTGKGNCWLYNEESLRYVLNFSAAVFIAIGTIIDVGVWHFVKDLKLFDDVVKTENSTTN